MMSLGEYIALFMSGMAFMFFINASIRILRCKDCTRTHSMLAVALILCAFLQIKELVFFFPENRNIFLINLMQTIDAWGIPACNCYLFELIIPGWINRKRILMAWIPFLLFSFIYYLFPVDLVYISFWIFIAIYQISVLIFIIYRVVHYHQYSNPVYIARIKKAVIFFATYMILWVLCNTYQNNWGDCIYYASIIILWMYILHNSKEPIHTLALDNLPDQPSPNVEPENALEKETMNEIAPFYPFREELERIMDEKQLYLNPQLTISNVANAIGTNRTYLSAYFNNELNISFYDYINNLRIEKVSKQLLSIYPFTMNLDEIAERSGFNSTSTFRRAFQKNTEMTPLQFRKKQMTIT